MADRFRALAEICQSVGVLEDLDALLETTLDLVVQHLRVDRAIVFVADGDALEARAIRGVEARDVADAQEISRSALRRALRGGGVLFVADAAGGSGAAGSAMMFGIRSIVAAPVVLRGEAVGAVYADTRTDPIALSEEDLRFVEAFASQVAVAIDNARRFGRVRGEAERMRRAYEPIVRQIRDKYSVRNLIGTSPAFRDVLDLVDRLRTGRTTVLLTGENGTGKELVARAVHYQSDRSDGPFIGFNCAALPESLLEAELFGIESGVATGVDARSGRFEDADGGTLFLDEVGDMSTIVQAKVLRVLQERTFERLGGKETIAVDVRVIAATSRDLEAMVAEGTFREDLYYRLAVFPIRLPALRERPEDIPLLARHFLERAAAEHGKGSLELADEGFEVLARHDWPGNVRELQNAIERAVLLASGDVVGWESFGNLAAPAPTRRPAAPSGQTPVLVADSLLELEYEEARARVLDRFDAAYLERALREHDGNVSQAAKASGLRRQRIHEMLKRLDLDAGDFR